MVSSRGAGVGLLQGQGISAPISAGVSEKGREARASKFLVPTSLGPPRLLPRHWSSPVILFHGLCSPETQGPRTQPLSHPRLGTDIRVRLTLERRLELPLLVP